MRNKYSKIILWVFTVAVLATALAAMGKGAEIEPSSETKVCLGCHETVTPGIVADWRASQHAITVTADAMARPESSRKVTSADVPERLRGVTVGCYECHGLNPDNHRDSFDHMGRRISVVISPADCRVCHERQAEEYSRSKKANAIANLDDNPVYHALFESILSSAEIKDGKVIPTAVAEHTKGDTCFACHGTKVGVEGMKKVDSKFGEVEVPALTNWPNQGVGRINPDGSKGACTSCHPRHSFSMEIARKPFTCSECHLQPDVPAWDVYRESKHGNIFQSTGERWNWSEFPWRAGLDFRAPTCAACHVSRIAHPNGDIIAEGDHGFSSRLWVRLFGLIYAHPQPISGDTTIIRNADGLPLPTTFTGLPASEFLIDEKEQALRKGNMKKVCGACHATSWTDGHFAQLDTAVRTTNEMTAAATSLMVSAWENGLADKTNPFDEYLEMEWIKEWLFYATSIRYSSAMGGQDYAAFKNGWFSLNFNLKDMASEVDEKRDDAE